MQENLKEEKLRTLEEFRHKVRRWRAEAVDSDERDNLRSEINSLLPLARKIVADTGCLKLMGVAPPAAIGGPVLQNIDPFASLFTSFWGFSVTSEVLDMVDCAIGILRNPLARALETSNKAAVNLGRLSPLPVLLSILFQQSGDDIVSTMGLCGLEIDWAISSKEGCSDKTRKRAYRQRVDVALSGLSDEEKLRISWIIAMEWLCCMKTGRGGVGFFRV